MTVVINSDNANHTGIRKTPWANRGNASEYPDELVYFSDIGTTVFSDGVKYIESGGTSNPSVSLSGVISSLIQGKSAALTLIGDSTGNATDEWFYRLIAEKIGPTIPATCIRYCAWNDTTQLYDPWITVQAGAAGERYARFATANSNRIIAAADVVARTSVDYEVEIKLKLDTWTPAAQVRVVGKVGSAGNKGWYIAIDAIGTIRFYWHADGTTAIQVISSAPGFVDGTAARIRVKFDSDNGAGNYNVKIDTSIDDGATWTSRLNSTGVGVSTIFDSTVDMQLGGPGGAGYITGNVYEAIIRDGLNGPYIVPATINAWGSATTAQQALNGTFMGSPTLYCFNGSQSGQGIAYFSDAARLPKMCIPAPAQACIVSTSHNDGATYNGASARWKTAWLAMITAMQSRLYSSGFTAITQNPRNPAIATGLDWYDEITQIQGSIPALATRVGVEIIDTKRAFSSSPLPLSTLVTSDGVHPSVPDGTNVIVEEMWRTIGKRILY